TGAEGEGGKGDEAAAAAASSMRSRKDEFTCDGETTERTQRPHFRWRRRLRGGGLTPICGRRRQGRHRRPPGRGRPCPRRGDPLCRRRGRLCQGRCIETCRDRVS